MKKLLSLLLSAAILLSMTTTLVSANETSNLKSNILVFENFDDASEWTTNSEALTVTKGSVVASGNKVQPVVSNGVLTMPQGDLWEKQLQYQMPVKKFSGRYVMEYFSTSSHAKDHYLRPRFHFNSSRMYYHNGLAPAASLQVTNVIDSTGSRAYLNNLSTSIVAIGSGAGKDIYKANGENYGMTHAVACAYTGREHNYDYFAVIDASGALDYEIQNITKNSAVIETNMPIFLDGDKSSVTVDGKAATITKRANSTCIYDVAFAEVLGDGVHTVSASLTNVFDDAAVAKSETVNFETAFVEGENILVFESFDDASEWTTDSAAFTVTKGSVVASGRNVVPVVSNGVLTIPAGDQGERSVQYQMPQKKFSGRYVTEYYSTASNAAHHYLRPRFLFNSSRMYYHNSLASTASVQVTNILDNNGSKAYLNNQSTLTIPADAAGKDIYKANGENYGMTHAVACVYTIREHNYDYFAVIDASGALNYEIQDITTSGAVIKTNMPIFLDEDKSSVTVDGKAATITKRANSTCTYDVLFAEILTSGTYEVKAKLTNVFGDAAVEKTRAYTVAANQWSDPDYIYTTSFDTNPIAGGELNLFAYIAGGINVSTQNGALTSDDARAEIENGKLILTNLASNGNNGNFYVRVVNPASLNQKKIVVEFDGGGSAYGKSSALINGTQRDGSIFLGSSEFNGRTSVLLDTAADKAYVYENDALVNTYDLTDEISKIGFHSMIAYKKFAIYDGLSIVGADSALAFKIEDVTTTNALLKTNAPIFATTASVKIGDKVATVEKISGSYNVYKITWGEELTLGQEYTAMVSLNGVSGSVLENIEMNVTPAKDTQNQLVTTLVTEDGNKICGYAGKTVAEVLATVTVPANASVKMLNADGTEASSSAAATEGMYIRVTANSGDAKDYVLAYADVRIDDVIYTVTKAQDGKLNGGTAKAIVYGKAYTDVPDYSLIIAQYDGDKLVGVAEKQIKDVQGEFSDNITLTLIDAVNPVIKAFLFENGNIRPVQNCKVWSNELAGKNIITIGDSITGMNNATYPTYIRNLGANVTNVGVSSTAASWTTNVCLSSVADVLTKKKTSAEIGKNFAGTAINDERLAAMDSANLSETDVVTILYGTNDYIGNQALKNTSNPSDITTLSGGFKYAIDTMLEYNPDLKIVVIAPLYRSRFNAGDNFNSDIKPNGRGYMLEDYANEIKAIADLYENVYFYDGYNESGINGFNANNYLSDGLHLSDAGNIMVSNKIFKFISETISE